MAGYRYVHQQAEETVAQTHTQEAMEADALASAAEASRRSERKRMS